MCYGSFMTDLLQEAIIKVMQLPAAEQNAAAEILLSVVARNSGPVRLDEETKAAVRHGLEQAQRGEFVPDDEMAEFFKHHG